MLRYQYAKFKENPCVGTDVSTPFTVNSVMNTRLHGSQSLVHMGRR